MKTIRQTIACFSVLIIMSVSARASPPASQPDLMPAKGPLRGSRVNPRFPTAGSGIVAQSLQAFPGAEGYGSHTPGGRGGRIIEVTNLKDSDPDSLRDALEVQAGTKIVVFRVSGTIELSSSINVGKDNSYVMVAGQTAPGDGIQIKNWPIAVSYGGHDVVIRYLRMHPGPDGITEENGGNFTVNTTLLGNGINYIKLRSASSP